MPGRVFRIAICVDDVPAGEHTSGEIRMVGPNAGVDDREHKIIGPCGDIPGFRESHRRQIGRLADPKLRIVRDSRHRRKMIRLHHRNVWIGPEIPADGFQRRPADDTSTKLVPGTARSSFPPLFETTARCAAGARDAADRTRRDEAVAVVELAGAGIKGAAPLALMEALLPPVDPVRRTDGVTA